MQTYFVDRLRENAEKHPDRLALALDFHIEPVTYGELWDRSGRIYAALKDLGIGREDIVMLLLPRHPMMLVCMLGALRAGAAVTMTEDTYPEERVAYMKNDCGAKLVIDRAFYEKTMALAPLDGREPLYPHDACFAFYTSGTTGKPKGILHEYGKLDIGIEASLPGGNADPDGEGRFAFIPPFNFSAVMIHALPELYKANALYILSKDVSRNFNKLRALLEEERITALFLSPSVLRVYNGGFAGVKTVATGSEPASNLFIEGPEVTVYYAMTESLYCVSTYTLKKACENAPIASKETGKNISILAEDGEPVKDGETGEICFPDPFFRGYINMPERTEEAFHDGLFHSGDLGFRDENGDIFIKGRSDDMIKINGNRIEPGEIEGAAREASGLRNVIAKGFIDAERAYVALYYLKSEAGEDCLFKDPQKAREKLGEKLPGYMIPSYFVPIEALPLNPNGKVSRKLLKAPGRDLRTKPFRAPEGEAEKDFCELTAGVLSLDRFGADDDFYEAGGDSISAIRLITACAERGYDITAGDLQSLRTPAGLARRFPHKATVSREKLIKREKEAQKEPKPLMGGQELYRALFERYPDHPSLCVPVIAELKETTDPERLAEAVNRVILRHPALLSRFKKDTDGRCLQYYDESVFSPVTVENMSGEEAKAAVAGFLKPVDIFSGRMYAARLLRTPEKTLFLFSVHHIMGDGTSNSLLLDEMARLYEDPEAELPPDCYYAVLDEETGEKAASVKEAARADFTEHLKKTAAAGSAVLKPDLPGPDSGSEMFFLPGALPRSEKYQNKVFLAAALKAMAEANGTDSALVYATYNGRDRYLKKDSAGCFTTLIPVAAEGIGKKTPEELLSLVREQLDVGMARGVYSAVTESGLPTEETVVFNYQYGTMDFGGFSKLAKSVSMLPRDKNRPNCLFNTGILDREGESRLDFYCNFPKGLYSFGTVKKFAESFLKAVRFLTVE